MSLLRTLLFGRENGIRSKLFGGAFGATHDTSPDSAYSAPSYAPSTATPVSHSLHSEPPRDVTPPEGFEVVLHVDALQPGQLSEVIAGGTAICVGNVDGQYYAISNTCPQGDGPLGEGTLSGKLVTCPYTGWVFDITTGECKTNPSKPVEAYEVEVKDSAVCVRL